MFNEYVSIAEDERMEFHEWNFCYIKEFSFRGNGYFIGMKHDEEIVIGRVYWVFDTFNWDDDYKEMITNRIEIRNKHIGMLILRKAIRLFTEFLYKYYPSHFYFSTHGDKSLRKFLTFLSKKLESKRYSCYFGDGKDYYFHRNY